MSNENNDKQGDDFEIEAEISFEHEEIIQGEQTAQVEDSGDEINPEGQNTTKTTDWEEKPNSVDTCKRIVLTNPVMEWVDDNSPSLDVPSNRMAHENEVIENLRQPAGSSEEIAKWVESYKRSQLLHSRSNFGDSALDRESADWQQGIQVDNVLLNLISPRINNPSAGHSLVGDVALQQFSAALGRGRTYWHPLPVTGIWCCIKEPTLTADINLLEIIADEKWRLGTITGGTAWSQVSTYTIKHVAAFLLRHIVDSNLKGWTPELLIDLIALPDLTNLARGMLAARHANGYKFTRPCTYNPDKCTAVTTKRVDFRKMLLIDNNMLSQKQKKQIAGYSKAMTVEDVAAYRKEFNWDDNETVINDRLSFINKVPTINEFIISGDDWIQNIVTMSENVLSEDKGRARDGYIMRQAKATSCVQYSAWIKEIRVYSEQSEVEDDERPYRAIDKMEAINETLATNAGYEEVTTAVEEGTLMFIANTTLSVFGVPNHTCEQCGNKQIQTHIDENGKLIETPVVPLDIIQLFMSLVNQRTSLADQRKL